MLDHVETSHYDEVIKVIKVIKTGVAQWRPQQAIELCALIPVLMTLTFQGHNDESDIFWVSSDLIGFNLCMVVANLDRITHKLLLMTLACI